MDYDPNITVGSLVRVISSAQLEGHNDLGVIAEVTHIYPHHDCPYRLKGLCLYSAREIELVYDAV